ncbi:MAG: hypothetical protein MJZ81_09215 [Bacteroidales bacterium]|nr:hypothetical protein [Bacteroidales bacterium]
MKFFASDLVRRSIHAMDGEQNGWNDLVDMEAHDRRHHHGHFNPETMTCSLRDNLSNGLAHTMLSSLPNRRDFERVVNEGVDLGLVDDNTVGMLNSRLDYIRDTLESWEGGDMTPIVEKASELSEVYMGLHDAFLDTSDVMDPNENDHPEARQGNQENVRPQRITAMANLNGRTPADLIARISGAAPARFNGNLRNLIKSATNVDCRGTGLGAGIARLLENVRANPTPETVRALKEIEAMAVSEPTGYKAKIISAANRLNPGWRDAVDQGTGGQETQNGEGTLGPDSMNALKAEFSQKFRNLYEQSQAVNPISNFDQMLEFTALGYGYQCAKRMMDESTSTQEALQKMSRRLDLLKKRHGEGSLGYRSMNAAVSDFCRATGLQVASPAPVAQEPPPVEEPPIPWTEDDFEDAMRRLNAAYTYGDGVMRSNLRSGLQEGRTSYMPQWRDAIGEGHVIYRRLRQIEENNARTRSRQERIENGPDDAEISEASRFRPDIVLDSQVHDFRNSAAGKGFSFAGENIPIHTLNGSCNCFKVSASCLGSYLTRLKSRPNACSGACYGSEQNRQFRALIDSEIANGWASLDGSDSDRRASILRKLASSGIDGIAMETWSGGHSTNKFTYNGVIYHVDEYYSSPKFKPTTPESTAAHISSTGEFAGKGSTAFIPNSSMKIPREILNVLHASSVA